MTEWLVVIILLGLSIALVLSGVLICRMLGVYRLSALFAPTEERAVLTKSEQHNGYMMDDLEYDVHYTNASPRMDDVEYTTAYKLARVTADSDVRIDATTAFSKTESNGAKPASYGGAPNPLPPPAAPISAPAPAPAPVPARAPAPAVPLRAQAGPGVGPILPPPPLVPRQTTNKGPAPRPPPPPLPQQKPPAPLDLPIPDYPEPVPDPEESGLSRPEPDSPTSIDSLSIAVTEVDVAVHGRLQRAMSCDSVSSDSSIMDIEPDMPRIGQLEFGLEYDREANELVVSIIQARDLEPNQVTGTLDSYVKVWLCPSEQGKMQTKVQKDTINPLYKERFIFAVPAENVSHTVVNFQVHSSDKYARHKLQGETELRLGDIELRQPVRVWMNLRDMDEKPTELGDIMFSLSYLPTAERLTVVVVKARNLRWCQSKDQGDCFVKVYLLQNNKKISKKKTSTKRGERAPIFNEAMIFSVPSSALPNVQLRIAITEQLADGRLSSIGHVIVGSQLTGTELTHWNQMMTSLRKPIAMWHRIRK